jgi:hypothetical protein
MGRHHSDGRFAGKYNGGMRWLVLTLALLTAACSGTAPPPYAPFQGNYGFSERQVDAQKWEVRYIGLGRYGFGPPASGAARRAMVDEAVDFALRRAAEIAKANNYLGFAVNHMDTSADSWSRGDDWSSGVGFGHGRRGSTWGFGSSFGNREQSGTHATATLAITLANQGTDRYYVADSVLAQVRQRYPGAQGGTP